MTYMIVNGTNDKVEFTFNDGGCCSEGWVGKGYREVCDSSAESVLIDGNYYTGPSSVGKWNKERRQFVHDQWLKLKDLIKDQLNETGKVCLQLPCYFTKDVSSETSYISDKLRSLASKIDEKKYSLDELIKISDILEI